MSVRVVVLFFCAVVFAPGQVVPGRYIVELDSAPASTAKERPRVEAAQQTARGAVEQSGAAIVSTVTTVANALIVDAGGDVAARLRAVPGVRKVYPVMEMHALLDAALPLHKVPDAWAKTGGSDKAGAGVKIGILDSGIDPDHPGFKDPAMQAPDGFPKLTVDTDKSLTSGKIIAARSYEKMFRRSAVDPGFRDQDGHGTAVAMAAAGVPHDGVLGRLSGVAPKAWLGIYRITRGSTGSSSSDVLLKALDDAVNDGMDVVNISFGESITSSPGDDPLVAAVERAVEAGVVVVTSTGNNGPDPNTISSPATAPSVLAVGASWNSRDFGAPLTLDDGKTYVAMPGNGSNPDQPVNGKLVDVPGLACDPLADQSLAGAVALILRGTCLFEDKLNNAAAAGAVAAVIRTDEARPDAIPMNVGKAALPGVMVSYADGLEIQKKITGGTATQAAVGFKLGPIPVDPNRLTEFSSTGPDSDDATIKPDLLAAGDPIYTATQSWNKNGELYDSTGYTLIGGTSFSSPLVAGAAAVLKAARPGLKPADYRSLLTGTATQLKDVRVQNSGSGLLNLSAALDCPISVSPTSVAFGNGSGAPSVKRTLSVTNLGTASDSFTITAVPWANQPAPALSVSNFTVGPNGSANADASFTASGLTGGEYQGFLVVRSTNTGAESHIPYWYAVRSDVPARITVLAADDSGSPLDYLDDSIIFRITEGSGINVTGVTPKASVVSGGGKIIQVNDYTGDYPGVFSLSLQLGPTAGDNVFRIEAGDVKKDVTIPAQ